MSKPKLTFILRIFVSLFLLALLLWLARKNFAKVLQVLSSVRLPVFILAFLLFMVAIVFMAWRLKVVLAAQRTCFSIKELFCLNLIGYFFTNFMPTSVGGDLVKAYYISKKNNKKLTAYTSVLIDRVAGMFSVAIIASVALAIMGRRIEHRFVIWSVVLLLACCLAFALFIFNKKLVKRLGRITGIARLLQALKLDLPAQKAYTALTAYGTHKGLITKTLILSVAAQSVSFIGVYLLSVSLSAAVPFGKVFLAMPVIFVLCMLPVTMNGLGLREWAFVLFFSPNVGNVIALSFALLYLAMFLLSSLIGGVIYLFWR